MDDWGQSDLTMDWSSNLGEDGLHAINWLTSQLSADPDLSDQIEEREKNRHKPEWLRQRLKAQEAAAQG
jgi:hypothetical protein